MRKGKQEEKDFVHRERRAINRNKKRRKREMLTELLERKFMENNLVELSLWPPHANFKNLDVRHVTGMVRIT